MFEFKEKEYTLRTFIDALSKVDKDISYIGTYFESTMLDSKVIAHPVMGVHADDDNKLLSVDVTLKPNVGSESDQVQILDQYLYALSMGFMESKPEPIKKEGRNRHSSPISKFLAQNSVTSEIQDHQVTVIFDYDTVSVKRMDTVINGVRYWKYALTDTFDLGDGVHYTHTVHCLLKEKKSDGENFFSPLVGRVLNKRDSMKVLDSVAGKNITGFFIGGYSLFPTVESDARMTTTFYGITDNVELRKYEKTYHLVLPGGGTHIPYNSIESTEVRRVGEGKYILAVYTSSLTAEMYLG